MSLIDENPLKEAPPEDLPQQKDKYFIGEVLCDSKDFMMERLIRKDFKWISMFIFITWILTIGVVVVQVSSERYKKLNKPKLSLWSGDFLWLTALFLSYLAIYILWKHTDEGKDVEVLGMFLMSAIISLAYTISFYIFFNVEVAYVFAVMLFVFKLWVFFYVFSLSQEAAAFMLPTILMFGYLVYSSDYILRNN